MEIKLVLKGDGATSELPCGRFEIRIPRMAGAGVLEVLTPERKKRMRCGMEMTLYADGEAIFSGFIFTIETGREGRTVTVCDRLRYLLCRDTKVYSGVTAGAVVKEICGERGIPVGEIESGGAVIGQLIADRQTLLDIIAKACSESEKLGGGKLTLFDDAGKVCLMKEERLETGITLTGDNLISSFISGADIGSDSYNRIQIVRKNRKSGARELFIREDAESIARWGVLQYSETVAQNTPKEEIEARLSALLQSKNRPVQTLTLTGAGDLRCRAGFLIGVSLPEDGIDGKFRILQSRHKMDENGFTMKLVAEGV